jgi:hypothetical protein
MKLTTSWLLLALGFFLSSCSRPNTQIGDNTFIHNDKVYKLVDNEIKEIGDLNANNIKKFEVFRPSLRDLGSYSLSYVKTGATATMKTLYRGNNLYYKFFLLGINDLKENYGRGGSFTISFLDEHGFRLYSTEIPMSDMVGIVGEDRKPRFFEYDGKTEMSTDISSAIKSFDIESSVHESRF